MTHRKSASGQLNWQGRIMGWGVHYLIGEKGGFVHELCLFSRRFRRKSTHDSYSG